MRQIVYWINGKKRMKWNSQFLFQIPTSHLEKIEKGLENALRNMTHGTLATDLGLLRRYHSGDITRDDFRNKIAARDTVRLAAIQKELEFRCDSIYSNLLQQFLNGSVETLICDLMADRIQEIGGSEVQARRIRVNGSLIQSKRSSPKSGMKLRRSYR